MERRHQHNIPTSSGETKIPSGSADQPLISDGETPPPAAPECLEVPDTPTDEERRRRWGRRVLDLLPFKVRWKHPDPRIEAENLEERQEMSFQLLPKKHNSRESGTAKTVVLEATDDEPVYDPDGTRREVSLEEEERLFRELREVYLRSRPRKRLTAYQFVTSGDFAPEMPTITQPDKVTAKDR